MPFNNVIRISVVVRPTRYDTFAKACLSGVLAFAASKKVQIKMGGLVGTDLSRPLRDLNRDKDVILLFHEYIWICFWRIISLFIR